MSTHDAIVSLQNTGTAGLSNALTDIMTVFVALIGISCILLAFFYVRRMFEFSYTGGVKTVDKRKNIMSDIARQDENYGEDLAEGYELEYEYEFDKDEGEIRGDIRKNRFSTLIKSFGQRYQK